MGGCRGLFDGGAVVGAVAGIISVRANQTEASVRSEGKMWECQREGLMGDWGRLSWQ